MYMYSAHINYAILMWAWHFKRKQERKVSFKKKKKLDRHIGRFINAVFIVLDGLG